MPTIERPAFTETRKGFLEFRTRYTIQLAPGIPPIELTPQAFRDSYSYLKNVTENLKKAEQLGCKPLSFEQVASQLSSNELENGVLSDTPPDLEGGIGNHWKIKAISEDRKKIFLQHSDVSGKIHTQIPLVEIPSDMPFFTRFVIKDPDNVDPNETKIQIFFSRLFGKRRVLWSNKEGKLTNQYPEQAEKALKGFLFEQPAAI